MQGWFPSLTNTLSKLKGSLGVSAVLKNLTQSLKTATTTGQGEGLSTVIRSQSDIIVGNIRSSGRAKDGLRYNRRNRAVCVLCVCISDV